MKYYSALHQDYLLQIQITILLLIQKMVHIITAIGAL